MSEQTLTPEQIMNWRKIIALQLYEKAERIGVTNPKGVASFAYLMPESEVIEYYKRITSFFANEQVPEKEVQKETQEELFKPRRVIERKPCTHTNSITGANGKFCLDCNKYVDMYKRPKVK